MSTVRSQEVLSSLDITQGTVVVGQFEVEKFRGEICDDELLSLWTVYEDLVEGVDINWEEVEEAVVETSDDALKVFVAMEQ